MVQKESLLDLRLPVRSSIDSGPRCLVRGGYVFIFEKNFLVCSDSCMIFIARSSEAFTG